MTKRKLDQTKEEKEEKKETESMASKKDNKSRLTVEEILAFTITEAARNDNLSVLRDAVRHGHNINCKWEGQTPLHAAAEEADDEAIIEYLIKNGADLNARNDIQGDTPLLSAFENSVALFMDAVAILVRHGSDVNATNNLGQTALHKACKDRMFALEAAKLLIENGASLDEKDNEGRTPLYVACEIGKLPLVQFLVNRGATVDTQTTKGSTPTQIAREKNHADIVSFFEHTVEDV